MINPDPIRTVTIVNNVMINRPKTKISAWLKAIRVLETDVDSK